MSLESIHESLGESVSHIEEEQWGHTCWRPHPHRIKKVAIMGLFSPADDAEELSHKEKICRIAGHFKQIMEILGLDVTDPSLSRTPLRVAKMYVDEIFAGLVPENFPAITLLPAATVGEGVRQPIFVRSSFTSFCEHHFVPMQGMVYISYCPQEYLIGLSKIPRIVKFFSSRPQLQERLTVQIADCLTTLLQTEDVAVSIAAHHFCVAARGIENSASQMVTRELRGRFETEPALRQEFFSTIDKKT